jgi:transcriptional regulator with XRE-family HTH domain
MAVPKQSLGTKIKALREKADLSLGQLAELSGVNKVTILRLERDEFTRPRAEKLSALARALGVDPAELLGAAGYASKEALPAFKPYLRTKYGGVLPAKQLKELMEIFDQIEAEYGDEPTRPKPRRTKGGTS